MAAKKNKHRDTALNCSKKCRKESTRFSGHAVVLDTTSRESGGRAYDPTACIYRFGKIPKEIPKSPEKSEKIIV